MATLDSPGPDPADPVISVSTTEVVAASPVIVSSESGAPTAPTGPDGTTEPAVPTSDSNPTEETPVWEARYSFWNFAGRSVIGAILIIGCLVLVLRASDLNYRHHESFRVLSILLGSFTTLYWLWLGFRIIRARLSHHYQLTSHRLFVSLGIFRRRRDMMELTDMKEVSILQQHFFDHLFDIGTVVVDSNVTGTPTLFVAGVKRPQQIMDSIYHHARD